MPGAMLSTTSQRVSPAAMPNSRDVWVSFDLEQPVTIKGMPLGDAPNRFIMFELTPARAAELVRQIQSVIGPVEVKP